MHLDVSTAELEELETILSRGLGDVREQIYKSEVADYKSSLKVREINLTALLERVRSLRTTAS